MAPPQMRGLAAPHGIAGRVLKRLSVSLSVLTKERQYPQQRDLPAHSLPVQLPTIPHPSPSWAVSLSACLCGYACLSFCLAQCLYVAVCLYKYRYKLCSYIDL